MNQDDRSLRGRLISSIFTLAVIALFLVMAVTSYCWFAGNQSVSAGGMSVTADDSADLLVESVAVYTRTETTYHYYNYDTAAAVSLHPFDAVFGRNDDSKIVLRILVSGKLLDGEDGLTVTLSRKNAADYSTDKDGLLESESGMIAKYLSNVSAYQISLTSALNTDADGTANAEAIYEGAITGPFQYQSDAASFVTISGESRSKVDELTFSLKQTDISNVKTGEGKLYLYVIVDYNSKLIQEFTKEYSSSVGAGKLNVSLDVDFLSDLDQMIISSGSASGS